MHFCDHAKIINSYRSDIAYSPISHLSSPLSGAKMKRQGRKKRSLFSSRPSLQILIFAAKYVQKGANFIIYSTCARCTAQLPEVFKKKKINDVMAGAGVHITNSTVMMIQKEADKQLGS